MRDVEQIAAAINPVRLLGLRRFPGFEEVDLADAALILGAMTERVLADGQSIARRGAPLSAAWFVVAGELAVDGGAYRVRVGAGEMVGMLELIAEIGEGLGVVSVGEAVVMELGQADLLAILAGNFEMLAASMRSLCRGILQLSPLEEGPTGTPPRERTGPLALVDSLLLLHELSPFGAVGAETMAELAASLTELSVAGVVVPRAQLSERILLVLEGRLRYGPLEICAGRGFGALQAIAEAPFAYDLIADDGTRLLVWSLDTVMDALDDDIPFALGWLRGLATRAHALVVASGTVGR